MAWVRVPQERAKAHPLYGVKNWAALLAFGIVLSGIFSCQPYLNWDKDLFDEVTSAALKSGKDATALLASVKTSQLYSEVRGKLVTLALLGSGWAVATLWLLLAHGRAFRTWFLLSLPLLVGLDVAIVASIPGGGGDAARLLIGSVPSSTLWMLYVATSKRIRVTTLHEVAADDKWLSKSAPLENGGSSEGDRSSLITTASGATAGAPRGSATFASNTLPGSNAGAVASGLPMSQSATAINVPPIGLAGSARIPTTPESEPVAPSMTTPLPVGDHLVRKAMAVAAEELKLGTRDEGLWALLLVNADGDESKARLAYLRQRGQELAQQLIDTGARAAADRERAALRATLCEHQASWDLFLRGDPLLPQRFATMVAALPLLRFPLHTQNAQKNNLVAYALKMGNTEMAEACIAAGVPIPMRVDNRPLGRWAADAEENVQAYVWGSVLARLEALVASRAPPPAADPIIRILRGHRVGIDEMPAVLATVGARYKYVEGRYRLFVRSNAAHEVFWGEEQLVTRIRSLVLDWCERLNERTG